MGLNKFPRRIKDILEYLDFIYDDRFENYEGIIQVNGDTDVTFRFGLVMDTEITNNIACYAVREHIITLFEVSDQISSPTFIVLLQEVGIINNRYVEDLLSNVDEYFKETTEV
jgi:hypothetical protein